MSTEIAILVILVLINGLFSGAEIATVTLRKTRVEQLLQEGRPAAKAIAELRANPERFLATVQIGITVIGAAAAAYGGDTLAERLTPTLRPALGEAAHEASFVIVVAGISYLSLVLGELVPKSLALRSSETYALLVARPLLLLSVLTRPLVWLLTKSSNAVLALFGDSSSFTESRVSSDELKAMLEEAGKDGVLHPRVGEIASRAMALNELWARDVMVPRSQIDALPQTATVAELRAFVVEARHSRIPLFDRAVDQVTGYVSVRDAFIHEDRAAPLSDLLRPLTFVPEMMRAADVLQSLQAQGAALAIVVDEHGTTVGLITREDLAEELFGAATSAEAPAQQSEIEPQPDGSVIVAGVATVRELNRAMKLQLPETDDWITVGGMCVGLAGRIPAKGERVQVAGGPLLEILDASPRRVRSVRLVMTKG